MQIFNTMSTFPGWYIYIYICYKDCYYIFLNLLHIESFIFLVFWSWISSLRPIFIEGCYMYKGILWNVHFKNYASGSQTILRLKRKSTCRLPIPAICHQELSPFILAYLALIFAWPYVLYLTLMKKCARHNAFLLIIAKKSSKSTGGRHFH